LKVYRKKPR